MVLGIDPNTNFVYSLTTQWVLCGKSYNIDTFVFYIV